MAEPSTTLRLLYGLAALSATAAPALTWRETQLYQANEKPITVGGQHPTADVCVAITKYDDQPQAGAVTAEFVQLRIRHTKYADGLALADSLRDFFRDRRYVDLRGVTASHIKARNLAQMGRDAGGRWEWALNLRLLVNRQLSTTPQGEPTP